MLMTVAEVASCDNTSDMATLGGQLTTAPQPRIFCHLLCARDWSMGDICLDRDELGWSASCSFEFFDIQIQERPRTSSCASGPLSDTNLEGNIEMYYNASASWEVKSKDEECSDILSLMVNSMQDCELCRRKSSVIPSLRALPIPDCV